jgi:two-component system, OmpR family, phosphate regulon sensor histidine kinase PhoR
MAQTRRISDEEIEQLESQIKLLINEQRALNRRVASLQRRNIRLQELNDLKDEFIAVASHQLRTPATGVKQYIGLLLEGYADPISPSQKLFLQKAEDSNNRQLQIIDDLLQVARVDSESFKLNISKVDINHILQLTVEELREKISKKRQSVFYVRPRRKIYAKGDSDRLRMVFENLIENASNYSPDDTTIEVRIRNTKDKVIIEIRDQGVGINRQDFPKLFQKFSRIPNQLSVEAGGTGLGLYWAYKIVQLHSGDIKVKSKLGEGTTFTVVLPIIDA